MRVWRGGLKGRVVSGSLAKQCYEAQWTGFSEKQKPRFSDGSETPGFLGRGGHPLLHPWLLGWARVQNFLDPQFLFPPGIAAEAERRLRAGGLSRAGSRCAVVGWPSCFLLLVGEGAPYFSEK